MARKKSKTGPRAILVVLFFALLAAASWYAWLRPSRDRGPAPAREGKGSPPPAAGSIKGEVELYFSSPDGATLVAERRAALLGEGTLGRCRSIIEELKKGPSGKLSPLLPPDLELRTLFVTGNVLVIDLAPEVKAHAVGACQEALLWYSLVNSIIMNVKEIGGVRFLVDGQEADTILGHVDMKGPFIEKLDLVRWS